MSVEPQTRGKAEGTPVWLTLGSEPLYAVLHEPPDCARRNTAVLLLPTFGWDEACSYRSRREWAVELAQAGFLTVRIDLPGTEDSAGSPLAPGRSASWVDAVANVVRWLPDASGCSRVAVIGIGLGALLALEATRQGAPIDDLLLWALPASGRACLRELRMYANTIMAAHRRGEAAADDVDGAEVLAGYLMSAETRAAVSSLSFAELSLPTDPRRNVLLISRDESRVDDRLRQQLTDAGANVTVAEAADEYAQMMTYSDRSTPPRETIQRSITWLDQWSAAGDGGISPMQSEFVTDVVDFDYGGERITERHIGLDSPGGRLFGILSEPANGDRAPFCVVSVDGGPLRRTSPSRMWTEVARRCAARGIPALRFDFEGIGDSGGQHPMRDDRTAVDERRLTDEQIAFHDYLEQHGVAASFATIGFCAGARREVRVALEDPRVLGSILINLNAIEWTPEQAKDLKRREALGPLANGLVARIRSKRAPSIAGMARAIRALVDTARGVGAAAAESQIGLVMDVFDGLQDADASALFLFSQDEPLYDQLSRLGVLADLDKWPKVTVEQLATSDHHLRPLTAQELVHARIDRFLTELLFDQSKRVPPVRDEFTGIGAQSGQRFPG